VSAPAIEVERLRFGYRAVIKQGNRSLEAVRSTEAAARRVVNDLYEDALFGCSRSAARAIREIHQQGKANPETRRRTP
jgi:hypothetical protein